MGFLSQKQLEEMGFAEIGENVLISDKCSIYNANHIYLKSNIRIDDFCILSAGENGLYIGNYVHIACYVSLIGRALIQIGDFVGISSKTAVYSSSDDYSGNFLTGPTVPLKYKNVDNRSVILKSHVILGAMCVVLPGVTIEEGVAVGSLSLVTKDLLAWKIYAGSPAKIMKDRSKGMLTFVTEL